jgi:TonB family protein
MSPREKFGKFVLLDEVERFALGTEFRAAKLGPNGLEKIVSLIRLAEAVSEHPELARDLMEQAKLAAQLQGPNLARILGIGKVESAYYVTYEQLEAKSLRAIFGRCRRDGFPFAVDHALLVVSKVCLALEAAHSRKAPGGARYFHGLVNPGQILVTHDGDVRVRGFGLWPAGVFAAGLVSGEDAACLAPEQVAGSATAESDVFAVGCVLFEALTGEPQVPQGVDYGLKLAEARLQSPPTDEERLSGPLLEILKRALAPAPADRYPGIPELRKAVDAQLFSGDFSPTTFNLAFFMHSLFREDIDREARAIEAERAASYAEFLGPTRAAARTVAPVVPATAPAPATQPAGAGPEAEAEAGPAPDEEAEPLVVEELATESVAAPAAVAAGGSRESAPSLSFQRPVENRSRLPLVAGVLLALVAIGAGGYWLWRGQAPAAPAQPTPTTLTPEGAAALARVEELEERLRQLEAEKAEIEARATQAGEQAKKEIEAQAKAKGQTADSESLRRAQEEARRKAQEEQQRRVEDERRRLEEQKKAEEARLAEERRLAEEAASAAAAAQATPEATPTPEPTATPTATPPPTPPPLQPGALVNINDAGVIAPQVVRSPNPSYPPIALRQRVEGTVELQALVDENGRVVEVQIISGMGGKSGLDEAAVDSVKRRRYKPAAKEGIPVKVWIPVRVQFKLPN